MTGKALSLNPTAWLERNRWVWAALGVLVLWAILSVTTGRFTLHSLSGVAVSASFLVIVALGQTLVVTTGRGNIDLSIASVMTLSAYASIVVTAGADAGLPLALLTVLGIGLVTGLVNALLVIVFRIPAIIATLATGYILATGTLVANRWAAGFGVSPLLKTLAAGRVEGVPVMLVIALLAVLAVGFLLQRTVYGRRLSAVGQNERAAALAGVNTGRIVACAFLASSTLAALAGMLLGAYVGGAFLEMGQPYLLQSLGAVVLGGSLIFGGSSTALGTLFGSLLLVLIVTTMQIAGLPPGTQDIVQGFVVIGVLALAGGRARGRRGAARAPIPAAGKVAQG
ncbi:ABC transporter permease [Ancylobacter dichloromethanicus]|uniref:ABC transporter permease n=1 Tax=Ancylobacter dichloromethanicus TaxID=518825 RepID=A0A9W6J8R5_9HYPH|nr:ABC transporter permease [Ancylobacter dichloromethanicus]MBS7553183.1 ABC transporter permease [Ancylobacter dichloromethanicus]GLK72960.1 ABC transporter permease [Ancylobacter dichloromethanicus]